MTVQFDDIDPHLFRYFVEYLYRDDWRWAGEDDFNMEQTYVLAARMYCFGERLQDWELQKVAFYKFEEFLKSNHRKQTIFELLRIVWTDLPERPQENGLRALLFLYTYRKLDRFRTDVNFRELLDEIPDLARYICGANHSTFNRLYLRQGLSLRFSFGCNWDYRSVTESGSEDANLVDPVNSFENISNDTVRVFRVLEKDPNQSYTRNDIQSELRGDLPLSDITDALEELSCRELVEEIKHGVWAVVNEE